MGIIQRQGIKNTIVTYAGILIGFLNLIVLQPLFLTPEEIGLTRVLFSFSSLISVFLPLGVGHIIVRYFPGFRNEEKRHHGFFGFVLLFPLAGMLAVALFLFLFRDFFIAQYEKESRMFADYFNYVIPLSFFLGLVTVLNIYAFALYKTTIPSILNDVVIRIFSMVVISVYFLKWITLSQFIFLFVAVYAVQMIALLVYIFMVDRPGFRIDFTRLKSQNLPGMFSYGFLLSFASVASLGLKYLDTIMIGHYLPLSYVGIYTIAAFIPTVIEAPLNSLEKIANTKTAAALASGNRDEIKEIYYKSSRYLLLAGGLLFAGINVNIDSLLAFLPESYSMGSGVVLIISIGTLFNMAAGSNTSIIFNSEHYKFGAFLLIFLVVIAFVLNMIFIPLWNLEGAAVATALSGLVYSLMKYFFIWKKHHLQPYDGKTLRIVLLTVLCFLLKYMIPLTGFPLADILIRSTLVLLLYLSGTYFMKIVPEFHQYLPRHNRE